MILKISFCSALYIVINFPFQDLPEEIEDEGTGRQQWGHPIEFLLSCVAMSVGLGNVWRFPMTAYNNGGGAFLIPYLIVLTFIGRVSSYLLYFSHRG